MVEDYHENHVTGWIKLYRSLSSKGWYCRSEYVHLWIHLLMKANHMDREFWFNGENVTVKRGQLVTGRKILSQETGISESKVERILKCFENEQQIGQLTNNRNRLISICYFDRYQTSEQQIGQQVNNGRTTGEQPVDTNKKEKNYNNDDNGKEERATPPLFEDQGLNDVFEKWIHACEFEVPLKVRKKIGESAKEALAMKLNSMQVSDAVAMVEQSLQNGWVTLRPVDQEKGEPEKIVRSWDDPPIT